MIPFGEQQNQENLVLATSFPIVDASDALVVSPDSELFFSTEMSRKLASEISIHLSKLTENDPREK